MDLQIKEFRREEEDERREGYKEKGCVKKGDDEKKYVDRINNKDNYGRDGSSIICMEKILKERDEIQ